MLNESRKGILRASHLDFVYRFSVVHVEGDKIEVLSCEMH